MKNKIDKGVLITGIIVLGVIIIVLSVIGFFKSVSGFNTISATGESSIKVMPDFVSIYFDIQTDGDTAEEANEKNSEIYDLLKSSLIGLGFEENEIQTQSFRVYPKYNWDRGSQTTEGFTASHSILIEIDLENRDLIGQAIDLGISSGAGISYINYELTKENQTKYKTEAIKMASGDARIKAEALAEGSGNKIGKLVSISTSNFYYQPWRAFSGMESDSEGSLAAEEIATQITPNGQEVSARVTAVFRIR